MLWLLRKMAASGAKTDTDYAPSVRECQSPRVCSVCKPLWGRSLLDCFQVEQWDEQLATIGQANERTFGLRADRGRLGVLAGADYLG